MKNVLSKLFGYEQKAQAIHAQKDQYTSDMIQIQAQARLNTRKARQTNRTLKDTTAYKYALAAGGVRRGL